MSEIGELFEKLARGVEEGDLLPGVESRERYTEGEFAREPMSETIARITAQLEESEVRSPEECAQFIAELSSAYEAGEGDADDRAEIARLIAYLRDRYVK